MALQSRINEIYPNRKPFMEASEGKRKAAGPDLRVRAAHALDARHHAVTVLLWSTITNMPLKRLYD